MLLCLRIAVWLCCSGLTLIGLLLICWSTLGLGAKSSQFKRKKGVLLVSSVVCRFGLVLEIVAIVLEIVDIVWAAIGLGYYCFGYCCRAAIVLDIAVMELKAFPMKGGDGAFSYTKNSQIQRASADAAKEIIKEAIYDEFDIATLSSYSNTIRIADFGCSIGPNTFIAMQNVMEAMEVKCHSQSQHLTSTSKLPEFHVFFNDHASNDFNTLFTSFPPDRHYFAAGVPGSFHGRLFPESSLHFVYSSFALQWLSKLPKQLLDISFHPQDRRRIHYMSAASSEVTQAYAAQFAKDIANFLNARANEIVAGGMMVLILPDLDLWRVMINSLEQSLIEMVETGSICEAKVDSFYLPWYSPSLNEMKHLIETNGCFSIGRMELYDPLSNIDGSVSTLTMIMSIRAVIEGNLTEHFGSEIIDELFQRIVKRSVEISSWSESYDTKETQLFLVLKRK
ncbi:gibberellin A4 carboxyl methyltransferase [Sarracenia purpurea var. burkii]